MELLESHVLFIHSFNLDISIAPLQVRCYSEAFQTTALTLCQSSLAEAQQATTSEGLAHGPHLEAIDSGIGTRDIPDARHRTYH